VNIGGFLLYFMNGEGFWRMGDEACNNISEVEIKNKTTKNIVIFKITNKHYLFLKLSSFCT